ncbi:TBC1 domain family member 5 [Battus philenor]|uniref:TBC1 domain family member 5 n=1 Tax=Battus philenor TaxID=42288 RepID=UPI0035D09945
MEQSNEDFSTNSPSNNRTEAADYDLNDATWTLEYLKTAAIQLRLVRPRSLAWAIMLNALPQPNNDIISSIKAHRKLYEDLRNKLSMDPRAVIDDDPLSQNDESVWKQHFCDKELKALILQDVVRTFPDEVYFRDKDVQELMVRVLFFWARSHSIGYRQGMHEILAPLLFELHGDRKYAPEDLSDTLKYYLDKEYLEHDSHMLFNAVMKGVEKFYSTGDVLPSFSGRLPTSRSVHSQNEVVRYLERVKEEFLVPLDHELATHLAECNISMELFGIRWLRLLFGREFPRSEIPHLWGFIFADGPMLPNLHFIIVAMLISMRSSLLEPEAGAALSALMRPANAPVAYVCALAQHLRRPLDYPRPPLPPPPPPTPVSPPHESTWNRSRYTEQLEYRAELESGSEGSEGVAEGSDVARSLAALALLRARLPPAAAALAAALPHAPPAAAIPLRQILQLAALLQCRNHALIDVETALEAAENQSTDAVGQHQIVPVRFQPQRPSPIRPVRKLMEVPLKVFHQVECPQASDLPFLDPLRNRTE